MHDIDANRLIEKFLKKKMPSTEWRPLMRKKWFRIKGSKNIVQANQGLLSFVFVRDPISRIISSYYDKMFGDWKQPHFDLNWMRKEIISKYRQIDPLSTDDAPTPSEFVQYILDSADAFGSHNLGPDHVHTNN